MEQIRQINRDIEKLSKWLTGPLFSRHFQYWFRKAALEARIEKLKKEKLKLIDLYLQERNADYKALVESNMSLVSGEDIHFKVTSITPSLLSSHSMRFAGYVSNKGYAYCNTQKGNFFLNPFADYLFPQKIEGMIDHWGKFKLVTTARGLGLFKTLPKNYVGQISDKGQIELIISETETDILSGGRLMIDRLMANLFSGNSQGLRLFQQNISEMNERISAFEMEFR